MDVIGCDNFYSISLVSNVHRIWLAISAPGTEFQLIPRFSVLVANDGIFPSTSNDILRTIKFSIMVGFDSVSNIGTGCTKWSFVQNHSNQYQLVHAIHSPADSNLSTENAGVLERHAEALTTIEELKKKLATLVARESERNANDGFLIASRIVSLFRVSHASIEKIRGLESQMNDIREERVEMYKSQSLTAQRLVHFSDSVRNLEAIVNERDERLSHHQNSTFLASPSYLNSKLNSTDALEIWTRPLLEKMKPFKLSFSYQLFCFCHQVMSLLSAVSSAGCHFIVLLILSIVNERTRIYVFPF